MKLGLILTLSLALLSGCIASSSSVTVYYNNGLPDASEHVFIRYSDGTVTQVPDVNAGATSVTVNTYFEKTMMGGYVTDGQVNWIPARSYSSQSVTLTDISMHKPTEAVDYVALAEPPHADVDYPDYTSVTFSVYDANDTLVTGRTEVFIQTSNPNLVFLDMDTDRDSSDTTAGGMSSNTINGLVTFLIKNNDVNVPLTSTHLALYSGAKLITDNFFHVVTDIQVSGTGGVDSVDVGQSLALNAAVLPVDAANPAVVWSVVDGTGSATIDADGLLTAVSAGTVTAKATAVDGTGIVGSMDITINVPATPTPTPTPTPEPTATPTPPPVLVSSIALTGESVVQTGGTIQLAAELAPVDAADKSIVWSVENGTGSASINASGLLTGISVGTVTVKAEALDGSAVIGTKAITVQTPAGSGNSGGGGGSSTTPAATATPTATPVPTPTSVPAPQIKFNDKVVKIVQVVTDLTKQVEEVKANPTTVQFTDTGSHWANKTVDVFVKLGIVNGYENNAFRPNASITRAEFATIISKVFGITGPASGDSELSDVSGHWAEAAIGSLQASGVISGYKDGTFKPNQEINRAEIIAILAKIINLDSVNTADAPAFTDINQVWNKEQIEKAAAAGIVSRAGDGTFQPNNQASRAEALTMVLHVLQLNPELKALLETL
ncbi:S-layer homology domain-containing protein [Paenibacillus algorifonticola]|nr:S-layer homology domain-containing protein [Paenibacillus algorifonticola]